MSKKDDLFDLVQSLSGAEKRYFKLFANRHITNESNLYLELFDWLESQSSYDEKLLKNEFQQTNLSKQLPVIKNYLKKNILKSLRVFAQNQSINTETRELIDYIEILFKKRLFQQCNKLIRKGKKISSEHEHFGHLLIFCGWEIKVAQELGDIEKIDWYLREGIDDQFHILNQIRDDLTTRKTALQFIKKYEAFGQSMNETAIEELKLLMNHQPKIEKPLSHRSSRNHYIVQAMYNDVIGNYEAVREYTKGLVDTYFENYPHKILPNAYDVTEGLVQIIELSNYLKKTEDSVKYLDFLKQHFENIPVKEKHKKKDAECALIRSQLHKATLENNKPVALEFAESLSLLIRKKAKSITSQNRFMSLMLIYQSYFHFQENQKALNSINEILNRAKGEVPQNILIHASIYQIIVHFEIDNYDLMLGLIRSFRRKYKLYQKEETFNFSLLSKLLKIGKTTDKDVKADCFRQLLQECQMMNQSKQHAYFFIKKWLEFKHTLNHNPK